MINRPFLNRCDKCKFAEDIFEMPTSSCPACESKTYWDFDWFEAMYDIKMDRLHCISSHELIAHSRKDQP